MQCAYVLLHACVAVDVDLHGAIEGALNGEECRAGRDEDPCNSFVVKADRIVVDGVAMIEAHDEVGGDDWFSGFAVEHKDGDGVCRLRAKRTAKRGCNDEGQEKANGKRASHERAKREQMVLRSQHTLTLSCGAGL